MQGKKYYTDQERFEFCRLFLKSGKIKTEFCREYGLNYSTFSDWLSAYRNISGKFINVNNVANNPNEIVSDDDYVVNILSEKEMKLKSSHFSRFDHSVVVIEVRGIKITTSLEQAERILGRLL
ncbi:MAG: transposase [Clostridia bacterium]|nr:transposase [Clostridia bacterium]